MQARVRVANAPCSWGVLEFEAAVPPIPAGQVLDEIAATGYAGTELGDWGFLPTDPQALADAVAARSLSLVGAFVPVALADASAHAAGIESAVRVAALLFEAAGRQPFIVLSDANTRDPTRTARAGRIRPQDGLGERAWNVAAKGAEGVARAVRDEYGLRTVFHHHCAGYVETPAEIDELMSRTDGSLLGLCLDTGHLTYAGGDPVDLFRRYADRVWHVHFKDCDPRIADAARAGEWDYHTAIARGVFCELGRGAVDFQVLLREIEAHDYHGWIVVEQDVLPGMGTPAASAARSREFLRSLGL